MDNLQRITLTVTGMTCAGCEHKIESKLKKTAGIITVRSDYVKGTVRITYDRNLISIKSIKQILRKLDYDTVDGPKETPKNKVNIVDRIVDIALVGLGINFLYHFVVRVGLIDIFNQFPQVQSNMGYGLLFIVGILTSLHCVAMCGGINLSASLSVDREANRQMDWTVIKPSLFYNTGRVVSYTILGGIIGGLGQVVSFTGSAKGVVAILAGFFMMIMGINLLNLFPWLKAYTPRMPRFISNFIGQAKHKHSGRFYTGLLNGLMPCGPLQAMQLYALSTGDPIKGALSMFFFSLGTVPLMFGLGAISSFLSRKFTEKMLQVSAIMVIILGFFMFQTGLGVSGFVLPSFLPGQNGTSNIATESEGIQMVSSNITAGSYESITVEAGKPARWTIHVDKGELNGCNNRIIIPKLGLEISLREGDNIIEFEPEETGTLSFTCWMGMIRSKIYIV